MDPTTSQDSSMNHPATTLYTKPSCVQCDATKRDLNKKGIEYTSVDMSADETALNYVKSLGHQQAPVIVLDTPTQPVHWSGYRPDLITLHFGKAA